MKVSQNSEYPTHKKYQTHEKPKLPNWRTSGPIALAPGALKRSAISDFLTSIVAEHQKIERVTLWGKTLETSLKISKN